MNMESALILEEIRHDIQKLSSPWLTREEAARYLKINPSTVNKLVNAGRLPQHKLMDSPRYKRDDLDKLVSKVTPER